MATHILLRHDTAADWIAYNPVLFAGEGGIETDTLRVKIGDGVTVWSALPYATLTPTDAAGTYVATSGLDAAMAADITLGGSATATAVAGDQALRDAVAAMLVQGDNVSITYDSVAGTITIDASGGGGVATVDYTNVPSGYIGLVTRDASGNWPVRPTTRTDVSIVWKGPDPAPGFATPPSTAGAYSEDDVNGVLGDTNWVR